ncbi:MAG: DegT/DnrJ/EryC1/StrS family aminotransferase [Alphaproteobacteria bacterium]|nr:DegT/DnrJ/EryC1/StrS family aminotransferase [Alphaproteobacteria bacterium]
MTPDAGALPLPESATAPRPPAGGQVVPLVDAERRPVDIATAGRPRRIPVAEPVLGGNELKYVTECITTNWISSQGTYVRRFEEMLGAMLGAGHVVSASNGTAALHLALLGYGIGAGDEVIVPDLTFAATINTVIHAGATPVIVDVDRRSWNIDPALVAAAITPRTRAIMPVHLYGQPADMDPLMALAEKHGLVVIEDAAEAIGARYKGRPCGTIGHAGTFSFFSNKVITTGEGGAVVLRDAEAAARARRMRDHGMDPAKRYWHNEVGYNYRLTNLQAAIGCAQLEQAAGFLTRKRAIAARYRKGLAGASGLAMAAQLDGFDNSYWMVSVIVDAERTGLPRDEIMQRLGEAGIDTRPLFYPLHDMPPYKPFAGNRAFPATVELSAQGFSLPSGVGLGDDEIDYICATLQRIVGARHLARRTKGA